MERLNELAACTDDTSCISRMFGTKAFVEAQQKIHAWMDEAGLITQIDSMGNVRGRKESKDPWAKTLVLGSHFDTVINAGKFDGPLGVVMAIELAEKIIDSTGLLPFNLEVIAFSDEEGVRFHSTFLGSRVVAGSFDESLLEKKDSGGKSLAEVISEMKLHVSTMINDKMPLDEWLGYFEIHIEQGPVLFDSGEPVAVVTAIAGQRRIMINVVGMTGHAGTVPMGKRQDALAAAAEMIYAIEQYGLNNKEEILATVGKIEVPNAATNVIAGEVNFSLDLRSADSEILSQACEYLQYNVEGIAKKRGVILNWQPVQETLPVICDQALSDLLITSMTSAGYKAMRLVSGAGHDAVAISAVAPVSMLFVRCYKGISHNPLEDVEIKDIAAAIQVSENFIGLLSEKFNSV